MGHRQMQPEPLRNQLSDRIVVNEKRGASVQRNYGAQHAKGEIFVFIDADTYLDSNFLTLSNNNSMIKRS